MIQIVLEEGPPSASYASSTQERGNVNRGLER